MTALVGFSGYARSGKNTAAEALVSQGYRLAAYADKLREAALTLNPVVGAETQYIREMRDCHEDYEWEEEVRLAEVVAANGWEGAKEEYPEVRRILQRLGTDVGRRLFGENVWVDALMGDLPGDRVAITDVRFPNEADAIRERDGLVIRVNRPGVGPAVSEDGGVHESETALDGYDFDLVVDNVGSTTMLQQVVRDLVVGCL
ncbi:deoxynucleotide monophosphate kinase family protein [Kineococcus esterisolvens]|uniref:deoxynucleotide monophosphate kinase family protein n=1 Tax=unclassified Kineococcus TaxID=2621656 RepID=UPI003D7D3AF1